MSDVVYFNFDIKGAKFEAATSDHPSVIKDALVTGKHKDNQGVEHEYPQDRVMRTALNTNNVFDSGEVIPFQKDHNPSVDAKLGEMVEKLNCRTVTEADIKNPRWKHLIGRLGAFTKLEVRNNLEKYGEGIINCISPGLDVINDRIVEISTISRPAIPGLAVFGQGNFSYKELKERAKENSPLIEELTKDFNLLVEAIKAIKSIDTTELEYGNQEALIVQAILDYTDDLAEQLNVDLNRPQLNSTDGFAGGGMYESNPYAENLLKQNQNNTGFSGEQTNVAQFSSKTKKQRPDTGKKQRPNGGKKDKKTHQKRVS